MVSFCFLFAPSLFLCLCVSAHCFQEQELKLGQFFTMAAFIFFVCFCFVCLFSQVAFKDEFTKNHLLQLLWMLEFVTSFLVHSFGWDPKVSTWGEKRSGEANNPASYNFSKITFCHDNALKKNLLAILLFDKRFKILATLNYYCWRQNVKWIQPIKWLI